MHIDIFTTNITVKNHTYRCDNGEKMRRGMTGIRYAFCYYNSAFYEEGVQWMDAFSVYWTAEELKAFRPNDTVHSFRMRLEAEKSEEIAHLKKKSKRASTNYIIHRSRVTNRYGEVKSIYKDDVGFNEKKHLLDRAKFLDDHSIVLVKINFE